MTNRQLAALCGTYLAACLITAGSTVVAVRPTSRRPVVAMIPRMRGDPYFVECRKGAERAARELGWELVWDGPTDADSTEQIQIVNAWITRRADAIAVAVADSGGLSPFLREARDHGIRVITWDSDADPAARDLFVSPAAPQEIGRALADEAECLLSEGSTLAVLGGNSRLAEQTDAVLRKRLSEGNPALKIVTVPLGSDDRDQALSETQTLIRTNTSVQVVVVLSSSALPGAAEAVLQSGRPDVKVIGLGLPASCRRYLDRGIVPALVYWNPQELGYLATCRAAAGTFDSSGEVVLGRPQVERHPQ